MEELRYSPRWEIFCSFLILCCLINCKTLCVEFPESGETFTQPQDNSDHFTSESRDLLRNIDVKDSIQSGLSNRISSSSIYSNYKDVKNPKGSSRIYNGPFPKPFRRFPTRPTKKPKTLPKSTSKVEIDGTEENKYLDEKDTIKSKIHHSDLTPKVKKPDYVIKAESEKHQEAPNPQNEPKNCPIIYHMHPTQYYYPEPNQPIQPINPYVPGQYHPEYPPNHFIQEYYPPIHNSPPDYGYQPIQVIPEQYEPIAYNQEGHPFTNHKPVTVDYYVHNQYHKQKEPIWYEDVLAPPNLVPQPILINYPEPISYKSDDVFYKEYYRSLIKPFSKSQKITAESDMVLHGQELRQLLRTYRPKSRKALCSPLKYDDSVNICLGLGKSIGYHKCLLVAERSDQAGVCMGIGKKLKKGLCLLVVTSTK